jgi:hypothetical protein
VCRSSSSYVSKALGAPRSRTRFVTYALSLTSLFSLLHIAQALIVFLPQKGVTLGDICTTIWKDYTENFVTDGEFAGLPPRLQEHIKRSAAHGQQGGWNMYYSPAPATNRFRRVGECIKEEWEALFDADGCVI